MSRDLLPKDMATRRPLSADPLERLERVCREIAHGNYKHTEDLFALTTAEDASPTIHQLAEAFGFMLVQVEAREMRLSGLIEDLRTLQRELEAANSRLTQENAQLSAHVQKLRIDIDRKQFRREVGEIADTDYFRDLQSRARLMRARHKGEPDAET
ncbi:hypothetical protein J5J86_12910 [Aquabacter sp. L1I39]|uniref:hypothetical protein n=1 Tax=Aquabacter sp. L1I39 TaxID=2820278 RepID=UPI001ADBA9DE|nr:hypothetical protein [Aquabacter sp. L1I39]QTL01718.1 hypothetical protein J5J86_12910 [Aquabacter sp. L1I39]